MRYGLYVLAALALSSCGPTVPDSGAAGAPGVGFESYPDYVRNREAALNGAEPLGLNGPVISSEPIPGNSNSRDSIPAGIARESGEMDAVGGIPGATTPQPGISDEQEFSAVSSRETIASDRERLARQRAEYTQIAPTALPAREGNGGPNIVEFAIQSRNGLGEQVYSRTNPFRDKQSPAACAKFASSDLAQEDFLSRGGPERDAKSLDPDGDGFACAWDPTPFRNAVN